MIVAPPLAMARVAGISLLAFLTLLGYELSRSSIESLFLADHGAEALPWAWLAVAATVVGVVAAYDHMAAHASLPSMFRRVLLVAAVSLALLAGARAQGVPGATFLLYVWKDVHVVVLLELLWTFASVVFPLRTARWAYGLFCAAGSFGGISGGLLAGAVAERWGTSTVVWLPLGVFALLACLASALGQRTSAVPSPPAPRARTGLRDAPALLRRSPYLGWMIGLVAAVQIVVTLVDYQFNAAVEVAYADADARTAFIGSVYAVINVGAIGLQILTGPLIRLLGVRSTLLAVPSLLGAALLGFVVAPRLAAIAFTKVASKALDYSIFKASKEMLYIPLPYEEKTRGKALVDILTYRLAKGGASAVLGALLWAGLGAAIPLLTLCIVACWIGITLRITTRWRAIATEGAAHGGGGAVVAPAARLDATG